MTNPDGRPGRSHDQTEDLLRRTFASHEGEVDPHRAGELMTAAVASREASPARPRRIAPVLLGLSAAASLLLAVVVGGVLADLPDRPEPVAVPSTSSSSARLLSQAEVEALGERVERATAESGTVSFVAHLDVGDGSPSTAAPPTDSDIQTVVYELDLRDPKVLKSRASRVGAAWELTPITIRIGDKGWALRPTARGGVVWRDISHPELRVRTPWRVVWDSGDEQSRAMWSLGSDETGEHFVVESTGRGSARTSSLNGPIGDSRTEMWVSPQGRIVKVRLFDGKEAALEFDDFSYGAQFAPINPPPASEIVEASRTPQG